MNDLIGLVLVVLVGFVLHFRSRLGEMSDRLERLEQLEPLIEALRTRLSRLEAGLAPQAAAGAGTAAAPVAPVAARPVSPVPTPSVASNPPVAPSLGEFVLPGQARSCPEPTPAAAALNRVSIPPAATASGIPPSGARTESPRAATSAPEPAPNWEERIGAQWLTWLGAVTAAIAVGLGLKLAFDLGYLAWVVRMPPIAYLILGWLAGAVLVGFSVRVRTSMPFYAQGLAGGGVAILYLTTYAGYALYGVLAAGTATMGLALTGAAAIGLALLHQSVVIGWIGVVLAYASPVLLGGDGRSPAPLFLYLTALNAAVLGISLREQWPAFRLGSFLATAGLYGAWHLNRYDVLLMPPALTFVVVNSLIFLAALTLYPLVWGERSRESDLAVAVLNPLLTGLACYSILYSHYPGWLGWTTLAFAAIYWLTSRALRLRLATAEDDPDYLEELFFATAVVLALLAVPLHLQGRVMTAAWALMGTGLTWVGYRTQPAPVPWSRTRAWGAVALALSVGRLLGVDVRRAPHGALAFLNERGFSFAVVLAALAVAGAVAAREVREAERTDRTADLPHGVLALLGLVICGLLDLWMALDLSEAWTPVGWAAVAGLALGYGWHLRNAGMRRVGDGAASLPLLALAFEPVTYALLETAAGAPVSPWPGWLAAFSLAVGAGVAYHRLGDDEAETAVPVYAVTAALLGMVRAVLALGPGWVPLLWLLVTLALLGCGVAAARPSLRGLALVAGIALTARILLYEWTPVPADRWLLHSRSVAALAGVATWALCALAFRRYGNETERQQVPVFVVTANLLALAWLCTEAMEAAVRFGPPGWAREGAQFALSATCALYAAALIVVGLRREIPAARWGGIVLLLLAVLKVYLFDLGFLALGYRVMAFLVMAVVLLGISYLYQRRLPRSG